LEPDGALKIAPLAAIPMGAIPTVPVLVTILKETARSYCQVQTDALLFHRGNRWALCLKDETDVLPAQVTTAALHVLWGPVNGMLKQKREI
jgi:hypothetical protein